MSDMQKQIEEALYLAENNPQKHHEWLRHQQFTISQQSAEIERLRKDNSSFTSNCHAAMKDAKHQKVITELAVKALGDIADPSGPQISFALRRLAKDALEEIKRRVQDAN